MISYTTCGQPAQIGNFSFIDCRRRLDDSEHLILHFQPPVGCSFGCSFGCSVTVVFGRSFGCSTALTILSFPPDGSPDLRPPESNFGIHHIGNNLHLLSGQSLPGINLVHSIACIVRDFGIPEQLQKRRITRCREMHPGAAKDLPSHGQRPSRWPLASSLLTSCYGVSGRTATRTS